MNHLYLKFVLAEATPETPVTVTEPVALDPLAPAPDAPVVLEGIAGTALVVITLLFTLLAKWLRGKFKAETEHAKLDSTKSLLEQRNFLIDNRLIPFAISTAEHWLISQLPAIVKDATDGGGFDWKGHWNNLRAYTRQRVLAKFMSENIDVLKFLGERELNDLLDRLLLKLLSKLPDGVKALIPAEIIHRGNDILTSKLTAFVIEKGTDLLTPSDKAEK